MRHLTDTHRAALRSEEDPGRRTTPATLAGSEHRRVVVGYDGSRSSRRALARGAEAAGSGGRVLVVTAVPPGDTLAGEHDVEAPLAEPEDVLHDAATLLGAYDVDVSTRVAQGEPAEALAAAASEAGAALLVVGARGDSYLTRALRGSVAEKLIARSPCDLLVVR
jgi:universal stress protein A